MIQDDGRLLDAYLHRVKRVQGQPPVGLRLALDQSFHMVFLFLLALLAAA
jgi:hypothetical protein